MDKPPKLKVAIAGRRASLLRERAERVRGTDGSSKAQKSADGFFWHRRWRLFQRRTFWSPTWLGSFCLAFFLAAPAIWWCCYGEAFLSETQRQTAEVLVVEGWIGPEGVRAAAREFVEHGYKYVIATGGLTISERWEVGGWSYAEGAQHELIRLGVAPDRILLATATNTERQRTFESAVAVRRALQAKGLESKALNVFTWGPHARRSRLVFAKVEQPDANVGVVSWVPATYDTVPWWRSSDRAKDLLTETAGYAFEILFNSGRTSNSPGR
jgi:hypothetical protein